VPVIVPVFIGGLRRADQMAFALEVRGFSAGRRARRCRARRSRRDLLLIAARGGDGGGDRAPRRGHRAAGRRETRVARPGAAALACRVPRPAAAWGLAAHRWVATRAAELVRERCPALVAAPRASSATPPSSRTRSQAARRAARGRAALPEPRSLRAAAVSRLPRDRRAAERASARRGRARGHRCRGTARTLARRLRDELGRGDVAAARVTAGHLAHYAADATMPLHTTENYDGQRTGQRGIHRASRPARRRRPRRVHAARVEGRPRRPIAPEGAEGALFAALEQAHERLAPCSPPTATLARHQAGSRLYYRRLHADWSTSWPRSSARGACLTAALWEAHALGA
jgi:hypothetical protein